VINLRPIWPWVIASVPVARVVEMVPNSDPKSTTYAFSAGAKARESCRARYTTSNGLSGLAVSAHASLKTISRTWGEQPIVVGGHAVLRRLWQRQHR
jgi:hypothetical protein